MRLRERYRRLNLWNKVAFWGAFASILGLLAALFVPILSPLLPKSFTSAEEAVAEGDTLFWNRQFEQAVRCYSLALRIDSQNPSTWRKKGISYIGWAAGTTVFGPCINECRDHDLKKFVEALPCLTRALQLDPKDKEAYLYRGLVYYRWGNLHPMCGPSNSTEDAFSQFEAAAKLNLERANYDTDKWRYESSCAHYGMALVMARLYSRRIADGWPEDRSEHLQNAAHEHLQNAAHIVPSCMRPDITLEQLMFFARDHPSDPSWGFATPPDPYRY